MSFRESVIIPLELFKKCNLQKEDNAILRDVNLPSDVKMKLYNQEKKIEKMRTSDKDPEPHLQEDHSFIINAVPLHLQPYVQSILKVINSRKEAIRWNQELEVVIDGKPFSNSNIVDLFKFITKSLVVTADTDLPIAAREFYNKLLEIGIPKSWIKATFPRRTNRIALQTGSGLMWTPY